MAVSLAKPVSLAKRTDKGIALYGIGNGIIAELKEDNNLEALQYLFMVQGFNK